LNPVKLLTASLSILIKFINGAASAPRNAKLQRYF
jgi:hypothetical protein